MDKEHQYQLTIRWTGNTGQGTSGYHAYERCHTIISENKPEISASSDPAFHGDSSKYNPEEFLVASLSGCHMLWFLHLCAKDGLIVTDYIDNPVGTMTETSDGGGKFKEVTLKPSVTIQDPQGLDKLDALHAKANTLCFIANSVNFPVKHHAIGKVHKQEK